jgi:hypothetical protein
MQEPHSALVIILSGVVVDAIGVETRDGGFTG